MLARQLCCRDDAFEQSVGTAALESPRHQLTPPSMQHMTHDASCSA